MPATLLVARLHSCAVVPTKGSELAAGYDLSSVEDVVIPAGASAVVQTGLAISVPAGTYGRVAPRSGLAVRHALGVGAGVIDADYRGPVGVVLFNHHDSKECVIQQGDRIAQLILEKYEDDAVVKEVCELSQTCRGSDGFGSTGV